MTPDDVTIIRQCWVYARLNATAIGYRHAGNATTAPGRPYFGISAALVGCGYANEDVNDPLWELIYRWMYHREGTRQHATRTTTN